MNGSSVEGSGFGGISVTVALRMVSILPRRPVARIRSSC